MRQQVHPITGAIAYRVIWDAHSVHQKPSWISREIVFEDVVSMGMALEYDDGQELVRQTDKVLAGEIPAAILLDGRTLIVP